jgi:hypothetical protein
VPVHYDRVANRVTVGEAKMGTVTIECLKIIFSTLLPVHDAKDIPNKAFTASTVLEEKDIETARRRLTLAGIPIHNPAIQKEVIDITSSTLEDIGYSEANVGEMYVGSDEFTSTKDNEPYVEMEDKRDGPEQGENDKYADTYIQSDATENPSPQRKPSNPTTLERDTQSSPRHIPAAKRGESSVSLGSRTAEKQEPRPIPTDSEPDSCTPSSRRGDRVMVSRVTPREPGRCSVLTAKTHREHRDEVEDKTREIACE